MCEDEDRCHIFHLASCSGSANVGRTHSGVFLKGALLKRNVEVQAFNHSIDQLAAKYRETFQEESFTWDIPFTPSLTEASGLHK